MTAVDVPKYVPWALINRGEGPERNIPDPVLIGIWKQMCEEGKDKVVFYSGHITCTKAWLQFIKSPKQFPVLIIDTQSQKIVMIAWYNNYNGGLAQGHFCSIGPYKRGAGGAVLNFWKKIKNPDGGQWLHTIWGTTPENYTQAIRLVKLLGFTPLGVLPNACHLYYENRRVGGMISYIEF